MVKKLIRDLASTMYDDNEFKVMSMPRVLCGLSGLCIVAAWMAEQFFGLRFSGWTQLVAWATSCLTAYGAKKYIDKDVNK